jgi:hypothetical protein
MYQLLLEQLIGLVREGDTLRLKPSLHPDWEYKLWQEEDIVSWDFASKDLFNQASS